MTKNQLLTIAVTVVLTVVLTKLLNWLASLAKISALTPVLAATRERAGRLFSKNNRAILWDIFWVTWSIYFFVLAMRETTPVTRLDIVRICVFLTSFVVCGASLIWHLMAARRTRELAEILSRLAPPVKSD
ncbi:MAG: hypothetical protein ABSA32_03445 [Candidatus Acidiferrales bacterium]|jgi:hypothetical protein